MASIIKVDTIKDTSDNTLLTSSSGNVSISDKLATTSTGIDVTGTVEFGDGHTIGNDVSDNLKISSSSAENIVYDSNGGFHLWFHNGTERMRIDSNGHLLPATTNTYDLGSSTKVWRNIYTSDFHMSNEGLDKGNDIDGTKGSWTFQEGEENLYLINNKNGKKYKFNLTEIE